MIATNTMRYGFDGFSFRKQAFITDNKGLNAATATSVNGFTISGVQPDGCNRNLIFKVDGTWYKLAITAGAATLTAVATQTPTIDSVLAEGNTAAELAAVTSMPAFIGKTIYTAIVLDAPPDAAVMPTIGLGLNMVNNQDQYQHDELSAEYTLSTNDVNIVSITADVTTTGHGSVTVLASLKQSDTWSGWMALTSAQGQKASAVKYKATYTATVLDGTDTAKVNSVSVIYAAGSSTVSGDTADIVSVTQNYENDLIFAECLVRHKKLMDAQINAFVAFRNKPQNRDTINVGTGNGTAQTVKLGIKNTDGTVISDTGINHNTLTVMFDGKQVFDYSYNTETSELTFTAATGVAVTASYEYGWEAESWREMTLTRRQIYNDTGYYASKYEYTLTDTGKTISDVKMQLYRPAGTVTDMILGTATGNRQIFVLPHFAKKETIICTGTWSYDADNRIFTVVAVKDAEIKISYDWLAESSEVYGLTAGWAQ